MRMLHFSYFSIFSAGHAIARPSVCLSVARVDHTKKTVEVR